MRFFFFLLFIYPGSIPAQELWESGQNTPLKSNLEIFYNLTDSSALKLRGLIPYKQGEVSLKLSLGSEYSLLGNKIISSLQKNGVVLASGFNFENEISIPGKEPVAVYFVIDNADVEYGEMFRKGFLGDYYISRNILLSGNFIIQGKEVGYNSFSYSYIDSVRVDEIKNLENPSFPFTQGEIPAEPFFSGLLEPVVAIGTAAVAVFLFFTIRSK